MMGSYEKIEEVVEWVEEEWEQECASMNNIDDHIFFSVGKVWKGD